MTARIRFSSGWSDETAELDRVKRMKVSTKEIDLVFTALFEDKTLVEEIGVIE
jgi:hypothetical protein